MDRILKKGDRVMVFEDCQTEKKLEGEATVLKAQKNPERLQQGYQQVLVHFDGEDKKDRWWRFVRVDKHSVNGKKREGILTADARG